jgi:nucleotide sugar dehydrogenase
MNTKDKIAIIGSRGRVGRGMVEFFENHYEVIEYDSANFLNSTILVGDRRNRVNECSLVVVCVPTPMNEDGSCDISIVEEVLSWVKPKLIWIRSTIKPGTTEYLKKKYNKKIVFSPEYMGESTYYTEFKFHEKEKESPFFVLGGDSDDTESVLDFIIPIAGPTKTYMQIPALEAEIAKYMENIYFAMKVTFANEMYETCQYLNANYWTVREAWGLDPRVDKMHTAVFANKRGFGGKCYPKDLSGFIKSCEEKGYNPEFLKEIQKSNNRFTKL